MHKWYKHVVYPMINFQKNHIALYMQKMIINQNVNSKA